MRSKGLFFLITLLAGLATLYFWNMRIAQIKATLLENVFNDQSTISEVRAWKMLELPEWPLHLIGVNQTVNALLLLYLGLMNGNSSLYQETKTEDERGFDAVNCENDNIHGHAKSFRTVKYVVEKVTSNSTLFCQVVHSIDSTNKRCYDLRTQQNKFTLSTDSSAELVRCFDPGYFIDIPQVYTSAWIKEAFQTKKIKSGVCVPVPCGSIRFQDSTFLVRFFFLVKPVQPIKIITFKSHLVISEKAKSLYLSEDLCGILRFKNTCNMYDIKNRAARCLTQFLYKATLMLSVRSFESTEQADDHYHLMSADFYFGATLDDFHLLRIHEGLHSLGLKNANNNSVSSLLNYQLLKTAINLLSRPIPYIESIPNAIIPDTFTPEDENELNVITRISFKPFIPLLPSFQPIWTSYTLRLPYESISLRFKVGISAASTEATLLDDKNVSIGNDWHSFSVGVGWNNFKIRVLHENPLIKAITYTFRVFRNARESLSGPVNDERQLVACQLEQDCRLIFKENATCGLRPAPFHSWNSALDAWNKLPPCGKKNDASGVWMVPCSSSCLLQGACHWSRALWQPFECRYSVPGKIQECLADRHLIFVGDSTNRGVMESLVERVDGSLTPADRIKWHSYRYRRANTTHFHFDYYPKYWLKRPPTLEQTLSETIRRTARRGDGPAAAAVAALVVGGLDWLAVSHFDTIRRVVGAHGERAKVVLKMAGYRVTTASDTATTLRTGQLHGLSLTARHSYHFLTLDAWNMTAARFGDFSPGQCQCHFHQIVESEQDRGRFVSSGDINRAYTDILIHHLCHVSN